MMNFLDRRVVHPGGHVFKEGDSGDQAFIIQSGTVELLKGEKVFAELGGNTIFGEMALIDGAPRMATARAKTETTLIVIPRSVVDSKLKGVDPFVIKLLGILVQNVRSMAGKLG
ncbi:cAMP-binding protein-catabolite gene activator and regulatory subunit of cAMP-dependent protein kinase [Magnetospirillum sp. XM-1]|uniref:cyclic nucleotide-binding domain-containing protein n=1 Tax=Magnetospirillum sp. XM-1 TaxID=1663591 RepID=UPI00073DC2DD|nr:cyclic nucleotide-binding domain-containing protein [Magnetospirillum sp. XM-1]CUW40714.1 cAMP-binding protein-catabolite gene activator and regulatory subunit of cAMP-dependent protein kinase [Magnetospirillum sp. XM-1]